MEVHVLDNPVWYTLSHDLADATIGTDFARRTNADIGLITAIADHSSRAFDDLAQLINTGETSGIFEFNPPQSIPTFKTDGSFSTHQMVCQKHTSVPEHDVGILELNRANLQDVQQLIEVTKSFPIFPGLFVRRRFVGIRQNGQLVAMAGERLSMPKYAEISAVCTHPNWRGHGYGTLLTSIIADGIWKRGQTPFLHVDSQNVSAYRIYEALQFVKRVEMIGVWLTRL